VEEVTLATLGEPPPSQPAASKANAATATTEVRMSGRRQRIMFGSLQSPSATTALGVGPDNVVHLGEAAEWWFAAE